MHLQARILKLLSFLPVWLALFAGGCSKPLSDAEHLARAKEFQEKGDLRAATIELKSALQQNPDNIEARRLLSEAYLKTGNGAAAEKELRRAVELGLAKEAVLLPLAQALLLQGKNQQILDEIDIPPNLPPHVQATLAAYRGNAWLALGKADKAKAEYDRALELDPKNPRGKLGLARLAAAKGDTDKALGLVEEALQVAPEDGLLWRFEAELHRRHGELKQAEEAYTKAIKYRPDNAADRANRALVRTDLKKFAAAAKDIEMLHREAPKFFLTHFADGYLKFTQGKTEEAKESLEQALALNDRYPFTYFYLGLLHLNLGELEQADARLSRFKAALPGSVQTHEALALVKYRQKDYAAARSLLMPVLLSQPDNLFALNLMANIELASGHPQEGMKYLEKMAELEPGSAAVKARLATGMLAAGLKQEGVGLLEKALAEEPNLVQPDVLLAKIYIRDKQFTKAREAIDRLKTKMPDHPLPWNLEAMWHIAQGDEAAAKAALEQAWKLDPGNPVTGENLARLAYKNKQFDQVRRIYEAVLEAHPDNARAQLRLAEMDFREGNLKQMEQRLNDLVQQRPELLQPRLELAKYYLTFGQPQRSLTLLEEVQSRHPKHPELLAVLTKARLEAKQPRRALESAKILAKVAPGSPLPHHLLAQVYARLGDLKNMRTELESALKANPAFLPARLAYTKLLALEGRTAEAQRALASLAQDFPDNPEVLALKGWWAGRQHQPEKAAEYYRKALARQPSSALTINLAKALWRAGKREETVKTLEDWNQRYPNDTLVIYFLSGFYQALGQEQDARKALARILEIAPKNPLVLNDLAWLLRKENPKQALEYAERAYAVAPKSAQIVDTLGMVLLENGQKNRALRVLEDAAGLAPANPEIRYHLAIAQKENGLTAEATATLKQALKTEGRFPGRRKAEALLETLTSATQ
ncbi:hypothetical protein MIN45_P1076 [Methylomarinovum tepidoasis]|uniref:PEP-CTERM system TPR-repeat protein PrsT n=1 Tax=Methylomarinovum tepidoasis TaxID=2840183 RepID=A0AAU9C5C0_9GAMM|nr:XrtA/PEP-CTERM system TPR-repeat protein PrsT [Methylomarinovum sp. IN45]BCX88707.1 hypothetical protein MIN45_P1076 [Methylomarinovum sp. IN45]